MRCLVFGCAGFIGSHLVDRLIDSGHDIYGIDNMSNGQKENINKHCTFFEVDIADKYKVDFLVHQIKPDYVFHLAAMARINECHDKPIDSYKTNVMGTLYLLESSRQAGVKGFVFSSSSSVYGNVSTRSPIAEDRERVPISIYGLEKLNAEELVLAYNRVYGLNTVALRYFNVYGTARQNPAGAYPNVFSAFGRDSREKGAITIYGDGNQERDYVHVFDVVSANTLFIGISDEPWGYAYNVGTGAVHTVNDIANYFPVKRVYKDARVGDPVYSCADSRKIQSIGWNPTISFYEGVDIFLQSLEEKYATK